MASGSTTPADEIRSKLRADEAALFDRELAEARDADHANRIRHAWAASKALEDALAAPPGSS